jgi:hypothetical protein
MGADAVYDGDSTACEVVGRRKLAARNGEGIEAAIEDRAACPIRECGKPLERPVRLRCDRPNGIGFGGKFVPLAPSTVRLDRSDFGGKRAECHCRIMRDDDPDARNASEIGYKGLHHHPTFGDKRCGSRMAL